MRKLALGLLLPIFGTVLLFASGVIACTIPPSDSGAQLTSDIQACLSLGMYNTVTGTGLDPAITGFSVSDVANVVAFGAKCDGATDDHTAFVAAVASLNGHGEVYVPWTSSTACVNGSPVTLPRAIRIAGAGELASKIYCPSTNNGCLIWADNGGGSLVNIAQGGLSNITVTGNGGTSIGVFLGGDPGTNCNGAPCAPSIYMADDLAFDHAKIIGFGNDVELGSNAFLDSFTNDLIYSASKIGFYVLAAASGTGEKIDVTNSVFNGNLIPVQIDNKPTPGDFNFDQDSFDFNTGSITGLTLVATFDGCHFEACGGSGACAFGPVSTGTFFSTSPAGGGRIIATNDKFYLDGGSGTTPEIFNLNNGSDILSVDRAEFFTNTGQTVTHIVNLTPTNQHVQITNVVNYNSQTTMPSWINNANWGGLFINPHNSLAPPALGVAETGVTTFANLLTTCSLGQFTYCSDCQSVADGILMASTCVGSGTGSIAVCKGSNTWKCGQ